MSTIIVLGGGIVGLTTAMLLARQGHTVTVFERDATPVPDSPAEAWGAWDRRGVAQFRQPHLLQSAARQLLDAHLPEVTQSLLDAGCVEFDVLSLMPPTIADPSRRPGDERFVTVTGRRTTLEFAVAQAAQRSIEVIRGVSVAGLITGRSVQAGVPHVTGVRLAGGAEVSADLVIDASGRRSFLPEWLTSVGAQRPTEASEESAFFYYTRYFRADSGHVPEFRAGFTTNFHSFSLLTLPGDAGTWSVTLFLFSGDSALKTLRDPIRWSKLIGACPAHAHWLDGEPISDVLPMGGVTDRYRRLIVEGAPVATGIIAVGDAAICTNPLGGRGISIGLKHAVGTAEVVSDCLDDPIALAVQHDAMTAERIAPWYALTVELDRARMAEIRATVEGRPAPPPAGAGAALAVGMLFDATLFRAAMEIGSVLALPREVFSRPGILDHAMKLADIHPAAPPQGPSREDVLRLVAG